MRRKLSMKECNDGVHSKFSKNRTAGNTDPWGSDEIRKIRAQSMKDLLWSAPRRKMDTT